MLNKYGFKRGMVVYTHISCILKTETRNNSKLHEFGSWTSYRYSHKYNKGNKKCHHAGVDTLGNLKVRGSLPGYCFLKHTSVLFGVDLESTNVPRGCGTGYEWHVMGTLYLRS